MKVQVHRRQPDQIAAWPDGGQSIGIAVIGHLDPVTGQVLDPVRDVAISSLPVEGFAAFVIGMLGSSNVDIVGYTAADNTVFVGIASSARRALDLLQRGQGDVVMLTGVAASNQRT